MSETDDDETEQPNHRKIWGAGFHAGLRAAANQSAQWSQSMNEARFKSIYSNLSALERRVLDSIPLQEPWTVNDIVTEYSRTNKTNTKFGSINHCLKQLVSAGLAKEPQRGHYIRTDTIMPEPKDKVVDIKKPAVKDKPAKQEHDATTCPLDQLFSHLEQATDILSKIESDVLLVEQFVEGLSGELKKVEQLKAILNSLK